MLRIFLISILIVHSAGAQTLHFEHLGIEDGLTQSSIMCSLQDSDGFLWIGTWDGLNRYDGYSFVQFRHDPEDSSSLPNNSIVSMTEAPDGRIWIATANRGVCVLDRRTGKVLRLPLLPKEPVGPSHCMVVNDTTIGVSTNNGFLEYDVRDPLRHPRILDEHSGAGYAVMSDDGDLWVVFDKTLVRRTPFGDVDRYSFEPVSLGLDPAAALFSIAEDSQQRLWIASQGGGLLEFDRQRRVFVNPKFSRIGLDNLVVRYFFEDSKGRCWVGTENGLFLAEFDGTGPGRSIRRFRKYIRQPEDPASLSHNTMLSISEDRTGVVWIGSNIGMNKLLPERKKFTHVRNTSSGGRAFHMQFPIAFLTEGDSVEWYGTQRNLYRRDVRMDHWREYNAANSGLADPTVHWLFRDSRSRLWVASRMGVGLLNERTGRFTNFLPDTGANERAYMNRVYRILEERNGDLWLATIRGIVRFDPRTGSMRRYLHDSLNNAFRFVLSMCDEDSILWLGTNSRGLVRFRKSTGMIDTVLMRSSDQQPGAGMVGITRDRNGTMWITTMGMGLISVRNDRGAYTIRRFTHRDGLANDYTYGVVEDDDGLLWISTNNGLSRFDPRTERFTNFTDRDGLPTNEFNQNAYHRREDGTIYFGGINGIVRFHPREIRHNDIPPPVVITSFAVTNEPRPDLLRRGEAVLKHTENYFSFEFAALCFEMPVNNRYSYKLEGLEEEWNEVGTRRFANYTDVDPGEYTFRVKGTNNDGVWNEQGASFRIIIVPPFYATVWFQVLVALTVIGSVAGGVRYASSRKYRRTIESLEQQKRLLEERQRVRDKIARDLHDDLASTVGSAGLFIETAKRTLSEDPEQSREFLEKTSSILNEAEEAMSDIVWSVSPKHDTLQSLAVRIRIVTTDLCRANGMNGTVEVKGNVDTPLTDDVRRGIYLIFKEALNNCVKHSQAATVEVCIGAEGNDVVLSVKDNGIGFGMMQQTESLGGNGMANIRKRAAEIGARCTVTSEPGKGTTVELRKEMTQLGH